MSRYLVTGCAGFIGSNLVDALLADGHEVVGIDCFTDYYPRDRKDSHIAQAREHNAFTLLEVDLAEEPLAPFVVDVDGVYHLAAQAGVRASWGSSFQVYTRNNVLATQLLLEACVAAEVPKVIYASSSSVYGDQDELPLREDMAPRPRSPYGVTKLAGEHLCGLYHANHGLDTVSLRLFTVYGPRQRARHGPSTKFITATLEGREIAIYGDGTQTRDFTFVDDIVEELVLARKAPAGAVMNLGGGNRVSLNKAIATLGEVMGVEPKVAQEPVEAGDVRDTWADVRRAVDLIGYASVTPLKEGLSREFGWLREETGEGHRAGA